MSLLEIKITKNVSEDKYLFLRRFGKFSNQICETLVTKIYIFFKNDFTDILKKFFKILETIK